MAVQMHERVVVTGTGVVSSIGQTVPEFRTSLRQGRNGIAELEGLDLGDCPIRIGGQVKSLDAKARLSNWTRDKTILHGDRYSWLAAIAATEAIS